jgi:hypothetical protein
MAHNMVVEEKRYSIEEVFAMCGEQHLLGDNDFNKMRSDMEVDGFKVRPVSLRYKTFYQKGCKCVVCGKEGTHFKLCGDVTTNRRHFNLYAEDGTLMTKDHILPRSRGGQDLVSNMQTMCTVCNASKGNTIEGQPIGAKGIEYIVMYKDDKEICKFKEIEGAIKYAALNFSGAHYNKISKTDAIKATVTCSVRVMQAIEYGHTVYGHRFVREVR